MKSPLFDTNILIDALNGHPEAFAEFGFWKVRSISAITVVELYAGTAPDTMQKVIGLLDHVGFDIIHIDSTIINIAARIRSTSARKRAKLPLADAIILATAQARGLLVVTRNKKDFKGPNVCIPYELETVSTTRVINVRPLPT